MSSLMKIFHTFCFCCANGSGTEELRELTISVVEKEKEQSTKNKTHTAQYPPKTENRNDTTRYLPPTCVIAIIDIIALTTDEKINVVVKGRAAYCGIQRVPLICTEGTPVAAIAIMS